MEHFTLAEFERSDVATRRGIDNAVPAALVDEAERTLALLERLRAALCDAAGRDVAVLVSSGYRCAELNTLVGGAAHSDHVLGAAADFTAPSFGTPIDVCELLAPRLAELGIGQLIHEFGRWVHVSTRRPTNEGDSVITISHAGTVRGIQAVLA